MAKKNLIKKGTQKNLVITLIIVIVAFLSYGLFSAMKIKKKIASYYNGVFKSNLKNFALALGVANADINSVTISEIATLYNDATQTLKNDLDNETNAEIIGILTNHKESQNNIEQQTKAIIKWQLNNGNSANFFTKLFF